MKWSSCLQYNLYTYRMELRRRRRRENILETTKAAITDQLKFYQPVQDKAVQVESMERRCHQRHDDILPETKAVITDQLTFYQLEPEEAAQVETVKLVETNEHDFLDSIPINEFNANFDNVFKIDAHLALEEFNSYYINF